MKVLVINCGSSSLKYQLIDMETEHVLAKGLCERIGLDGHLKHTPLVDGKPVFDEDLPMPTHSEAIAAVIDTLLGNPFGVAHALLIGMAQGLGAEIGFAVFAYRKWNLLTVTLAGALTGLSNGLYEWVVTAGWSTLQGVVFTVCCVISGAVFGGALMWFVQKALAKTGVLDRFESGKADVVA